jgi:hypothetical protein
MEELAEHNSGVQSGARTGLRGDMVRLCEGVASADRCDVLEYCMYVTT